MLTGAARRGAASCGSLLIAAVPSSPIESGGFPTSSFVAVRVRGVGRVAAEVLGQARLACLPWVGHWGGSLGWVFLSKPRAQTGV